MPRHPSVGFTVEATEEEQMENIISRINEKFSSEKSEDVLVFPEGFEVLYGIPGKPAPAFGFHHDGLIFVHTTHEYPDWNTLTECGDVLGEVSKFIQREFEGIETSDVKPVVRSF